MKKKDGISLISLVITIVIIIILASISIYNGLRENIDETENTMDYNEIFDVSDAVAQRALFNRFNSDTYKLIGESGEFETVVEQNSGDERVEVNKKYSTADGWYLIDSDSSKALNLEKVRRKYLVNYATNEVVSLAPIYYEGNKYYTADELRDAIGGGNTSHTSNRYDEEKGVNKPYVIDGMIPVKRVGTNWVITNADDGDWYDYASTTSTADGAIGNQWANVMLLDEIEVEGMTNEAVRKASISELEGKKVTKEGSMFVWIPRYSRGLINGEMKIVYSKLTDDYFKDKSAGENVLKAFEDNGIELTGIWVSKYDVGYIEN